MYVACTLWSFLMLESLRLLTHFFSVSSNLDSNDQQSKFLASSFTGRGCDTFGKTGCSLLRLLLLHSLAHYFLLMLYCNRSRPSKTVLNQPMLQRREQHQQKQPNKAFAVTNSNSTMEVSKNTDGIVPFAPSICCHCLIAIGYNTGTAIICIATAVISVRRQWLSCFGRSWCCCRMLFLNLIFMAHGLLFGFSLLPISFLFDVNSNFLRHRFW